MNCHLKLCLALAAIGISYAAAESISDELAKLKGQPVGNVTARLGDPESQQPRPGGTTYIWTYSVRVEHAPITRSQTEYGSGRPSTYETRGYSSLPITQSCSLQVAADSAGTIAEAMHSGSNAACASMVRKLGEP